MQYIPFRAALLVAVPLALAACSQGSEPEADAASAEGSDDLVAASADIHMAAASTLRDAMKDTFDEGQMDILLSVAHQTTVAATCDDFDLDNAKAQQEMAHLNDGPDGEPMEMTEAEKDARGQKALLGLGMAIGSQMTIAAVDPTEFCAVAEEDREDPAGEHVLLKPAATT